MAMGDMSDLPNFKRNWVRRIGLLRVATVAVVVVLAAIAFGFSEMNEALSLSFTGTPGPALIGAPYTVQVTLKNDESEKSMIVTLQAVIVSGPNKCISAQKNLTMSHPITVNVPPSSTVSTTLNFDSINAPCEMLAAGVKAFMKCKIGDKESSTTLDTGLSLQIL